MEEKRQIILDTETTGLSAEDGHRIIQIACVELKNRRMTGNDKNLLVNPERKSDAEAYKVHGIADETLASEPLFADLWEALCDYLRGAEVVIHNADFDLAFLDAELTLMGRASFVEETGCQIVDTLGMARRRYPASPNSLDALCERYNIDKSERAEHHQADIDAKLLARVYLALTSGQEALGLDATLTEGEGDEEIAYEELSLTVVRANEDELAAHEAFLDSLDKEGERPSVWRAIDEPAGQAGCTKPDEPSRMHQAK